MQSIDGLHDNVLTVVGHLAADPQAVNANDTLRVILRVAITRPASQAAEVPVVVEGAYTSRVSRLSKNDLVLARGSFFEDRARGDHAKSHSLRADVIRRAVGSPDGGLNRWSVTGPVRTFADLRYDEQGSPSAFLVVLTRKGNTRRSAEWTRVYVRGRAAEELDGIANGTTVVCHGYAAPPRRDHPRDDWLLVATEAVQPITGAGHGAGTVSRTHHQT